MKIKLNPDVNKQNSIKEALKQNDGYCPCRVLKTHDNKCMCREFRESTEEGYCHCGLFYKEKESGLDE